MQAAFLALVESQQLRTSNPSYSANLMNWAISQVSGSEVVCLLLVSYDRCCDFVCSHACRPARGHYVHTDDQTNLLQQLRG